MGEWIHKFISDREFEQYDLAMPSVVEGGKIGAFKREEFQARANNSQNQQGPKAPSAAWRRKASIKDDGTSDKKVEASTVAKGRTKVRK